MVQTLNINYMDFIKAYLEDLSHEDKHIRHLFIKVPCLDSENLELYLANLQLEFATWYRSGFSFRKLETIYISGAQCNKFALKRIVTGLEKILKSICFSNEYEFTIELSAKAISTKNLILLDKIGVNRIVLNYYEIDNDSSFSLFDICNNLKKMGFENLSIDYLYNFSETALNKVRKDLSELLNSGIKHIYIEDFDAEQDLGELSEASIINERKQYHFIRNFLRENKFQHYELLAFAVAEKYKSKHNLAYWNGKDYLGIGVGAASRIANFRFINNFNVLNYINNFNSENLYLLEEKMTKCDLYFDYFMLAINKLSGFNEADFLKYTGKEMPEVYKDKLEDLRKAGLLEKTDDSWVLTVKGLDRINFILREFIC